ncbi:seven-hairpin glycosidase [Auriculariales sp. MPI-PUGE-AT-0066]|nr:seven-hairpin glycosidase [Auriculariales sp. MPI-PUGE-AT-0066]
MPRLPSLAVGLLMISLVNAGNIQKLDLILPDDAGSNFNLVKNVFLASYQAYKDKAWTHDDLAPISGGFKDPRNGWGATVFDALGTLKVLGEEDLFKEAIAYASQVDFSHSNTADHVSFFETTIRYLGGMLAAYDLNGQSDAGLLNNAVKLADKLLFAYPGGNYLTPVGSVDFSQNVPDVGDGGPNGLAAAASNILEFYKLSQYSGNQTYLQFGDMTMRAIANNPAPVFPGLPPLNVNANGTGSGSTVTWDGGYDSYLEYLIKYARLTNFEDPLWAKTWLSAAESTIEHLIKQSTGGTQPYFITSYDRDTGNHFDMGDLACFAGGNFIMGGKLLDREDIVDWGLRITDGCMTTYNTPTGLGVGSWGFKTEDGGDVPAEHQDFFNQNGWYPKATDWNVRPEVFESVFYAWRATGDKKYYDFNARAAQAIQDQCKSNNGIAALKDVMKTGGGTDNQMDDLESFFFAEVSKYLALTFQDPEVVSLDKWVFNTECERLRRMVTLFFPQTQPRWSFLPPPG